MCLSSQAQPTLATSLYQPPTDIDMNMIKIKYCPDLKKRLANFTTMTENTDLGFSCIPILPNSAYWHFYFIHFLFIHFETKEKR